MRNTDFKEWTTFELLGRLVPAHQRRRALVASKGTFWRFWESRDKRYERVCKEWDTIMPIVADRFKPVLLQLYRGLETTHTAVYPLATFCEKWVRAAWENIGQPPWVLPARFWNNAETIVNVTFGTSAVIPAVRLKPKFMLRPFVDDLGNSDARGILRSFAYADPPLKFDPVGTDVKAACADLCRLLGRVHNVERRTAGVVPPAVLSDETDAVRQVCWWLFGSWLEEGA